MLSAVRETDFVATPVGLWCVVWAIPLINALAVVQQRTYNVLTNLILRFLPGIRQWQPQMTASLRG